MEQPAYRPTVGNCVVETEQQHMVPYVQSQKAGPQQRPAAEVERSQGVNIDDESGFLLPPDRRQPGEVDPGELARGGEIDHLSRPALFHLDEASAEDLMPANDLGQAPFQRRCIQLSTE